MILRLTVDVKDESHQNEVLNRVEATGAQLLGVEGIVAGKNYHILPPQTVVPLTPLLDLVEYQKQVRDRAEKSMVVVTPTLQSDSDRASQQFDSDQPEMVYHMPFLTYLAAHCTSILEIGAGHGNGSTRAFERGLKGGDGRDKLHFSHVTVDIDPERPHLKPVSTENYHYRAVTGDSRDPQTYAGLTKIHPDVIYIDTDHTYEVMQKELEAITSAGLVTTDTILVFHDTWMFGEYNHMTDAIKEWCSREWWVFVDLTRESHGMGVAYTRKSTGEMLVYNWMLNGYAPKK